MSTCLPPLPRQNGYSYYQFRPRPALTLPPIIWPLSSQVSVPPFASHPTACRRSLRSPCTARPLPSFSRPTPRVPVQPRSLTVASQPKDAQSEFVHADGPNVDPPPQVCDPALPIAADSSIIYLVLVVVEQIDILRLACTPTSYATNTAPM